MKFRIWFIIICFTFCLSQPLFSQPLSYDANEVSELFEQGKELFAKKNYAASREILDEFINKNKEKSEKRIEAEYMRALSAMYLENRDAELLLENFVEKYPEKSTTKKMYFQLATHQFANRSYSNAMKSFKKVNTKLLNNEEKEAYHFKYGYSLYRARKHDEAQKMFKPILNSNSDYAKQANYYHAHIAYENQDYQTALNGFNKLKDDKKYKNLVSYYIVQIYYHQEKPQQLLQVGLPLLNTIHEDRKPELSQLIGQAYYQLSDYDNAAKYLENYQDNSKKRIPREKQYELGFTYFQIKDYEKALENFKASVSNKKDSLTQNAYYHLGMCYLYTDQPTYAANSFYSAYKIELNESLREDALYNYVKLSYENPNNTYNTSVEAVKNFLNDYPNSRHKDEINEFLVDIFLSSKDYQSAIKAFNDIDNKTPRLQKAYQQITFYRGIDLYNEKMYEDAILLFQESLNYKYDNEIMAKTLFWLGDAYYQKKRYSNAYKTFNKFLKTKGAYHLSIYPTAYYNLGYIMFSQKKYEEANSFFTKYIIGKKDRKKDLLADAYTRLGDTYFIQKDYTKSIVNYQKAIENDAKNADYAMYQKALAYGGKGEFNAKINTLSKLISNEFQESPFKDDAEYEMGITYMIQDKSKKAIESFSNVYTHYPYSPKVKQAYLKAGLIYYNMDQSSKSIQLLKKVVENYPESVEAREALASIKNIYIDMNNVDEYFKYANNVKYASVTATEKDSVLYITAENLYMKGDCDKGKTAFERYLDEQPKGVFVTNAHFYTAECYYKNENFAKALPHYEKVINQKSNEFYETAISKSALITFNLKNYNKALEYFTQLSKIAEYEDNKTMAYDGLMKINYQLKNYKKAIASAEQLLKQKNTTKEQQTEAYLITGRSAINLKDRPLATSSFTTIANAKRKNIAAEANYYLARLTFEKGEYTKTEDMIFKISEQYASEDEWLAKSFVLLSDVYVKTGDLFQAKQTLQSIIDNYKGEELVNIAKQKKTEIEKAEQTEEQKKIDVENEAKENEKDIENY